jgi:hypothetical protein
MKFNGTITLDSGVTLTGEFELVVRGGGGGACSAEPQYKPGDEVETPHGVGVLAAGSRSGKFMGCPDEDGDYWVSFDGGPAASAYSADQIRPVQK